ncbi:hypothetical protein OAC97_00860 [Flavobacteriaceae bacterium]|nr:hypothetical protein [Flavobacteriaceae bacterium]
MNYLKLGLLFSAFGCFFEVVFTSIYDSIVQYIKEGRKKVDVRFFGYWSILYILVYGVVLSSFWILVAVPYIYPLHWGLRALIYGLCFQAGEYICMYALHLVFGESPSESHYRGKYDSVHDFIRLSYFPVFVIEAFAFELIYAWFM